MSEGLERLSDLERHVLSLAVLNLTDSQVAAELGLAEDEVKQVLAAAMDKLRSPAPDALVALTQREEEILALCADGLASKAIALRLQISEHTVKQHLKGIFDKLGVANRAQAAAKWAASGRS